MKIALIIAGVADPKKPLVRPATGQWADLADQPTTPFKLSPFDEAALETALKLRDKNPEAHLTVFVTDGAADVAFLRSIAAHRIDQVMPLPAPAGNKASLQWLAHQFHALLRQPDPVFDLVLVGREHGDLDDGVVPGYLAWRLDLPFASLALRVLPDGETGWLVERMAASSAESVHLPRPAMVSITNDKSNKLRHPLMKNVMAAKQQKFAMTEISGTVLPSPAKLVAAVEPEAGGRRDTPGTRLDGDVQSQARALAHYLKHGQMPGQTLAH